MATLLASFAVPLLWRAPRAALQPLVGPGVLLVLSVCFEGAGKSAQQSAWLFGATMVVHVLAAPHWFRWPKGTKQQKQPLANRRVLATIFLLFWCVFAAHQVGGWCAASPAQLAWRCAATRRLVAVLDQHKVRWHATKSTLMEALRDGLQGRPSLSTFNADEDLCVHDEDYERACHHLQEDMGMWPGAFVTKNTVRQKGALAANFVSLAQGSHFKCWGGRDDFEAADRQRITSVHIPCGARVASPSSSRAVETGVGVDLHIPANAEDYLLSTFGASWRTPIIDWGSTRVALHDIGCNIAEDHGWPYAAWISDRWIMVLSGSLLALYTFWWISVLASQQQMYEEKGGRIDCSGGRACRLRRAVSAFQQRSVILYCVAFALCLCFIRWWMIAVREAGAKRLLDTNSQYNNNNQSDTQFIRGLRTDKLG